MDRIPNNRFSEPILYALRIMQRFDRWIPPVRFICADPLFIGLHSFQNVADGRGYNETAHVCYPWHLDGPRSRWVPTIVLPEPESVEVIVHELAHILDYGLGFSIETELVSQYAKTDREEAFAEAVTSHLIPEYLPHIENRDFDYRMEAL